MNRCLLAFGANSGRGLAADAGVVRRAVRCLPGRVVAVSRLYRTPAHPPGAGPDFVNAAVVMHTPMSPGALLDRLHDIEGRFGRVRKVRWGMRTLDIDLLGVGRRVLPSATIWRDWRNLPPARQAVEVPDAPILPHPRMQDRAFVLIPLLDVAPGWRHPLTGRTVRSMAGGLSAAARREIREIGAIGGVVNTNHAA